MKKFLALLLSIIMVMSLAACGSSGPDKQPAVDAFNSASTAYDALVDKINPNIDAYPQELIDIMQEMGSALAEHKNILESDQQLTEEQIKDLTAVFGKVEAWAKETEPMLDNLLAEANSAGDKQAVIDLFNKTSKAFNEMATKINANIGAYDQQVVDVMTQMANALNECKTLLESDKELTAEQIEMLMSNLTDIENWVKEADSVLVEEAAAGNQAAGASADKQAAIDAFNNASGMFNAIATEINAHIGDFPQEVVDGMTQMAEGLNAYKAVLESGQELTQEQIDEIIEICAVVEQWALEVEDAVFG